MPETIAPPPPLPWLEHQPAGDPLDPGLGGPLRVTLPAGSPLPDGGGVGAPAGTVFVVTDGLLVHVERLAALREALANDALALARITAQTAGELSGAPVDLGQGVRDADETVLVLRAAAAQADRAETSLRWAITAYSDAESGARQRMLTLGAVIGQLIGPLVRALVLLGLPVALGARAVGVPTTAQLEEVRRFMLDHPEVITSPEFVEAVRAGVMSIDETAASALGWPAGLAQLMAAALGVTGVQVGAAVVIAGATPLGFFHDGPVFVERSSTSVMGTGPRGAVERLARVPEGDQVRIERYDAPGEPPRYVVYVGPTETFSPVARDEPWDLTSNVTGVAGLDSGSLRATEQAMRDAGIGAGDAVQLVGFSQGGLVAARVAASGDWNTVGLETYGAPTGNIALPDGLHGMAVRNSDDFIPALAGPQVDHTLVQIERRAFDPGAPIPTELPAPAHQRNAYVATATEIDRAESAAVREQVAALDAFTSDYTQQPGSRVTVLMYHATRGVLKQLS